MRSFLTAAVVALATGSTAHAQQVLSAGGIFGGPAQVRAVCYFHNSGTTTLGLSGLQITNQLGVALPLAVNECGTGTLLPGRTCGIAANVPNNAVHNCRALVSPRKTDARGILEARDSGQRVLTNVELR
jgi:ABC-type uncharacterized transport system permease subunit